MDKKDSEISSNEVVFGFENVILRTSSFSSLLSSSSSSSSSSSPVEFNDNEDDLSSSITKSTSQLASDTSSHFYDTHYFEATTIPMFDERNQIFQKWINMYEKQVINSVNFISIKTQIHKYIPSRYKPIIDLFPVHLPWNEYKEMLKKLFNNSDEKLLRNSDSKLTNYTNYKDFNAFFISRLEILNDLDIQDEDEKKEKMYEMLPYTFKTMLLNISESSVEEMKFYQLYLDCLTIEKDLDLNCSVCESSTHSEDTCPNLTDLRGKKFTSGLLKNFINILFMVITFVFIYYWIKVHETTTQTPSQKVCFGFSYDRI